MSEPPPEHPDSRQARVPPPQENGVPANEEGQLTHLGGEAVADDPQDTVDGIPLAQLLSDSGDASTLFQMDDLVPVSVDQSENRLDSYADARLLCPWRYGRLLEATHPKLQRRVQLLVLDSPYSAKPTIRERFLDRVREVASVQSPFVHVGISEAVVDDDKLFLVLEPIRLNPLDMFRPRTKAQQEAAWFFPNQLFAKRLSELAQGVEAIHRGEIVHGAIDDDCIGISLDTDVARLEGLINTATIVESNEQINAPILDRRAADLRQLVTAVSRWALPDWEDRQSGGSLAETLRRGNRELSPTLIELLSRFADSQSRTSFLSASELVQRAQALADRQVRLAGWLSRLGTLALEMVFVTLLFVLAVFTSRHFFSKRSRSRNPAVWWTGSRLPGVVRADNGHDLGSAVAWPETVGPHRDPARTVAAGVSPAVAVDVHRPGCCAGCLGQWLDAVDGLRHGLVGRRLSGVGGAVCHQSGVAGSAAPARLLDGHYLRRGRRPSVGINLES